jgi:ABC-type cobalamin/Fe3+-siderophores transport system ATPase subunit
VAGVSGRSALAGRLIPYGAMDALLSFQNVSLTFSSGQRHLVGVLSDVSFDLACGELVAVLAGRAQGKTTLLRTAAGFEKPVRGKVVYKGSDLSRLSDKQLSRLLSKQIAFVEPIGPDLDLPVISHVALPLLAALSEHVAYERAAATLRRVGAEEYANQRWSSLADSERVLATLAQGLVREPELLLVDDLMATLNMAATEQIGRLLHTIAREDGMLVLMSASDAEATTWFDRVATLAGGELYVPPPAEPDRNVIDFPSDQPRSA